MSEEKKRIRVLIADDHPVVRTGLQLMLGTSKDIEVVGEAIDGAEALRLVSELQPEIVLMDLRMPGMDGLEAIEHIRAEWPQIIVIVLTTYNEDELMLQSLQAGARGFLLKDTGMGTLLDAIRHAARGEMLVRPEIIARILSLTMSAASPPPPRRVRGSLDLTARELEILTRVAHGERSKEIALQLGITERTVGAYLTTIYTKLNVDSRASAVAVAIERGLLPRQGKV